MSSRSKGFGRSMIPNYAITDHIPSNTPKHTRKKKSKSDFPTFGSDAYKEPMLVVDKSKIIDRLVKYMIIAVIVIGIMLALVPFCILILKKWKWGWMCRLFGINPPDTSYTSMPTSTSLMSTTTPVAYIPTSSSISGSMNGGMTGSSIPTSVSTPISVNPTGDGIDINKPYVVPVSALKAYSNTEL